MARGTLVACVAQEIYPLATVKNVGRSKVGQACLGSCALLDQERRATRISAHGGPMAATGLVASYGSTLETTGMAKPTSPPWSCLMEAQICAALRAIGLWLLLGHAIAAGDGGSAVQPATASLGMIPTTAAGLIGGPAGAPRFHVRWWWRLLRQQL